MAPRSARINGSRHSGGGCTLSKQTPRPAAVVSPMGQHNGIMQRSNLSLLDHLVCAADERRRHVSPITFAFEHPGQQPDGLMILLAGVDALLVRKHRDWE
jgi:hypothetical protein